MLSSQRHSAAALLSIGLAMPFIGGCQHDAPTNSGAIVIPMPQMRDDRSKGAVMGTVIGADSAPRQSLTDAQFPSMSARAGAFVPAVAQAADDRPATQPVDARPATQPIDAGPSVRLPYTLTRFTREGPVSGVVVKLDLGDPRVHVVLHLNDDRDPDGDGPAVGRLDILTSVAARQDLEIAMNASYFAVTGSRITRGKKVGYFVGNGAYPVGWEVIDHQIISRPQKPFLKACLIIHDDGRVTIENSLDAMPADARYAVSGSSKVLSAGAPTPPPPPADGKEEVRHPRSAVGVSADGKTLLLMAIDGRRPTVSRGVTLGEEAALLKEFGASDGIHLDGGGSSALVIKDAVTGVHAIVNKPSEFDSLVPPVDSVQRPVIDVLGVKIDE